MMTTTVFYGFGAYVASLVQQRVVKWWPQDPSKLSPAWDHGQAILTDLDKTPNAVKNGTIQIAQIECDDHTSDAGLTQIGPRFPQGLMIGMIWLAKPFYDNLQNNKPPRHQSSDGADYELTSILYWNGNTPGKRYYGFRGQIVGQGQGNKHKVKLWKGGRGKIQNEPPQGTFDIDFANDTDTANNEISPGGTQDGAIYVEEGAARQLQLMSPKRPESAGYGYVFGR